MKLANCSFCGSAPRLFSSSVNTGHNDYILTNYVICPICKARGPVICDYEVPSEDERSLLASEGWNVIHGGKGAAK